LEETKEVDSTCHVALMRGNCEKKLKGNENNEIFIQAWQPRGLGTGKL
jgi:hypothetical protein